MMSDITVNKEATIASYLHAYEDIEKEISGLSADQLKWKASTASWSITEVLAHLVDHSIVVSFRIREILAGSKAQLPAFEQDAWVSGQRANEEEVANLLTAANALVRYNAYLLLRLNEEEWFKSGINAKGEQVAIAAIIPAFVKHVQGHLGQIRRVKEAALAVK